MINNNLICYIMALNNDLRCLRLNKTISKYQYIFWKYLTDKNNIITKALKEDKIEMIKSLLPYIESPDEIWLLQACCSRSINVVRFLLDWKDSEGKYLNVAYYDNIIITSACRIGCLEIVKLLLQQPQVDISSRQYKVFIHAINYDHTDIYNLLLQHLGILIPSNINNKYKLLQYVINP